MKPPSLTREREAWSKGLLLVGVDEVGRGPLAGPVVAAAVVFPPGHRRIRGVRDSKTLPPEARRELAARIRAAALCVRVAAASVREIDRINIRQATILAMRRALCRMPIAPARVLIDGLPLAELGMEHEALVDGDALCYSVAAAGIVAKTVRDDLMRRLARRYPEYGWDHNVGYATELHREAIGRLGPTRHHRVSFSPISQIELFTG
ncbi:MAG: ribonuclease HII [Gemmatimonadota bacterium]